MGARRSIVGEGSTVSGCDYLMWVGFGFGGGFKHMILNVKLVRIVELDLLDRSNGCWCEWGYRGVRMWGVEIRGVKVWGYGDIEVWELGGEWLWGYGDAEKGDVEVWGCVEVDVWGCEDIKVWGCGIRGCGGRSMWGMDVWGLEV